MKMLLLIVTIVVIIVMIIVTNITIFESMDKRVDPVYGDHIYINNHHGIYVGYNSMIEYPEDKHIIHYNNNSTIEKTSLQNFVYPEEKKNLRIRRYGSTWNLFSIYRSKSSTPEKSSNTAHLHLGSKYDNINSEEFAFYCKTGIRW